MVTVFSVVFVMVLVVLVVASSLAAVAGNYHQLGNRNQDYQNYYQDHKQH